MVGLAVLLGALALGGCILYSLANAAARAMCESSERRDACFHARGSRPKGFTSPLFWLLPPLLVIHVGGSLVAAVHTLGRGRSGGGESRIRANEASAIASLRTLLASQELYKNTDGKGSYGSLSDLGGANPPFIDSVLSSGTKSGYRFEVGFEPGDFTIVAAPLEQGRTGGRSFFVDSPGVIRQSAMGDATSGSKPMD